MVHNDLLGWAQCRELEEMFILFFLPSCFLVASCKYWMEGLSFFKTAQMSRWLTRRIQFWSQFEPLLAIWFHLIGYKILIEIPCTLHSLWSGCLIAASLASLQLVLFVAVLTL